MSSTGAIVSAMAVASGAVLALAGCAGAPAPAAPATQRATDSPLYAYTAQIYGNDDAVSDEKWQQVEYLTATCMADEGFDYTPERTTSLTTEEQYQPDDPSWVARWGYGILQYPDASGRTTFFQPMANTDYVSSLEGAEYGEYYEALYGEEDAWAEGCYGSSVIDVWGTFVTRDASNTPIMAELDAFQTALQSNPDLAQIDAEWAECMAGYGYEGFTRQNDASLSIFEAVSPGSGYDPDDSQRRDELHRQEVDLALTDLDCRQQVDYSQRTYDIQFALEEEFIAVHKAELDALIAEAEASRAEADAD